MDIQHQYWTYPVLILDSQFIFQYEYWIACINTGRVIIWGLQGKFHSWPSLHTGHLVSILSPCIVTGGIFETMSQYGDRASQSWYWTVQYQDWDSYNMGPDIYIFATPLYPILPMFLLFLCTLYWSFIIIVPKVELNQTWTYSSTYVSISIRSPTKMNVLYKHYACSTCLSTKNE